MASDLDSVIDVLIERIKTRAPLASPDDIGTLSSAVLSLAQARSYGRPFGIPAGLESGASLKPAALEVE